MVTQNQIDPTEADQLPDDQAGGEPTEAPEIEPPAVARLKQQAPRDRRSQKQLATVAVVFVAAFLLLVYLPSIKTLSQLHERLTSNALQLESNRERSRALPQLRATADRLERELKLFKQLPGERKVGEVINQATKIGLQLQLHSLRQEQRETVYEGGLGIVPVQMTFEGNFENVYSFLNRCEQLPDPVRVHELKIQPKAPAAGSALQSGEVSVTLVLNVYFKAEASTGA
jgi:Tfp pilus assembly protein PilO